jgi:hypothetical protein
MPVHAAPRNVDEGVDAPVIRDNFLKSLIDLGFSGYVQTDKRGFFTEALDFGGSLFSAFFINIKDHCTKVISRQTFRYRSTNTGRSTRDNRDPVHKQLLFPQQQPTFDRYLDAKRVSRATRWL